MKLTEARELRRKEYNTYGDRDMDYGIYKINNDYIIINQYEYETFYPTAKYIDYR